MSIRGYAIKKHGEVDITTVSATETEAKAKWLCASTGGAWEASGIDAEFAKIAPHSAEYPSCIRVNITELP